MPADRHPPQRWIGIALGLAVLAAGGPRAVSAGDRIAVYSAVYSATWAGLPAAQIRLTLRDGAVRYDDRIAIETRGLPWLFTRFRATATAEGRLGARIPAAPLAYDAVFDLHKRRDRRISMRFVEHGGASVIERGPGDTRDKPPLSARFRTNAVDPLSALERIREAVATNRTAGAAFTVPVYDGTRRFDVVGRILGKSRENAGTLRLALILRPVAGFKDRPGAEDPENAPRTVELLVTDDARALPLRLRVPIWFLPLVIRLDRVGRSAGPIDNRPGAAPFSPLQRGESRPAAPCKPPANGSPATVQPPIRAKPGNAIAQG